MDTSFYTAARGAMTHQEKMNIISNNIANVNTVGYKSKSAVFTDLMYYNMHGANENKAGTGVKIQYTNTDFSGGGIMQAGNGGYDYAIEGDGFFMLGGAGGEEPTYTRAGNFSLSVRQDGTYLVSDGQKPVLDAQRNPIRLVDGKLTGSPAVFRFANTNGMESVGANEFRPVQKNGLPVLAADAKVQTGVLEMSNVDVAQEMADTIITSRAYSYALKMVQTADEVEQTINSLR